MTRLLPQTRADDVFWVGCAEPARSRALRELLTKLKSMALAAAEKAATAGRSDGNSRDDAFADDSSRTVGTVSLSPDHGATVVALS